MSFNLLEWVNLVLRWVHVFAGILWVGTTYYFTWLDGRFTELEERARRASRENEGTAPEHHIWMVHSGGFYIVEKQKQPSVMPGKLHWFRWEAAITWLSGFLLFGMVYYHGKMLVPMEDAKMSAGAAMGLSFALLFVGWLVYDFLWKSPLVANEKVGLLISYLLIAGTTYGLFKIFAGRAACLQLGAMLGTLMTANVWMRILPAQRRMVQALNEGRAPDLAEGLRAKTRSKHNTFIVVPVVFLMLSTHYTGTYYWQVICGLVLAGWVAAAFIRRA